MQACNKTISMSKNPGYIESDQESFYNELHRKSLVQDIHIGMLTRFIKILTRHCIEDKEQAAYIIKSLDEETQKLIDQVKRENFVIINNSVEKSIDQLKDIPGIEFSE